MQTGDRAHRGVAMLRIIDPLIASKIELPRPLLRGDADPHAIADDNAHLWRGRDPDRARRPWKAWLILQILRPARPTLVLLVVTRSRSRRRSRPTVRDEGIEHIHVLLPSSHPANVLIEASTGLGSR